LIKALFWGLLHHTAGMHIGPNLQLARPTHDLFSTINKENLSTVTNLFWNNKRLITVDILLSKAQQSVREVSLETTPLQMLICKSQEWNIDGMKTWKTCWHQPRRIISTNSEQQNYNNARSMLTTSCLLMHNIAESYTGNLTVRVCHSLCTEYTGPITAMSANKWLWFRSAAVPLYSAQISVNVCFA